jgi:hypothetical protein
LIENVGNYNLIEEYLNEIKLSDRLIGVI